MTFPMAKKKPPQLTFIVQAEIQVQEASPKEKKEKGTLINVPKTKEQGKLHLPSNSKPSEVPSRSPKSELTFLKEKEVSFFFKRKKKLTGLYNQSGQSGHFV